MLRALLSLVLLVSLAQGQDAAEPKPFAPEELEQLVAPIALHPDSLVSQILMASTYPLEVVQADRWVKAQKTPLEGDALATALEAEAWQPSVKSLVNFPDVLDQMSVKLDWTVKLGDAFLAQETEVLAAVQRLRARAKEAGHLETTGEQTVIVEQEVIVIEPARTEVIYVPTYNPTIVYGPWPYPAYPPAYYYPPGYVFASTAFAFTAGVIIGSAWGYAWGGCGWHSGRVDIDINRNVNLNANIDRDRYRREAGGGKGNWKHDPKGRAGVKYRDQQTSQRFGKERRTGPSSSRDRGRPSTGSRASGGSAGRSSGRSAGGGGGGSAGRSTRSRGSGSVFGGAGSRGRTTRDASRGRSSRAGSRGTGSRSSGARSSGRSRGGRRGG